MFLQPFAPVTIALDKTQYWQSENGILASYVDTVSQAQISVMHLLENILEI